MFLPTRRAVLVGLSLAAIGSRQLSYAQPAAFPSRPIKVVVPFPAGGAADIAMRFIGPKMAAALGQPVVIENRVGANGSVGAAAVARSDPDGHTLLFAPREVFSVNQNLQAAPGYDPVKDFSPIGIATEGPYLLVVHPSVGVRTMAEFLALARTRELSYSSFGIGSMGHLNPEVLARHAGVKFLHVPYRGAPAALQAVVGAEVNFTISTPPNVQGLVADGKVIALAVGAGGRIAQAPDVPTLAEVGLPATVLNPAAFAMAAPAGTPTTITSRLSSELGRVLAAEEVTAALTKAGLLPVSPRPDAMATMIADDIARFGALIKELKIKID